MFLSCPPKSVRLSTALAATKDCFGAKITSDDFANNVCEEGQSSYTLVDKKLDLPSC